MQSLALSNRNVELVEADQTSCVVEDLETDKVYVFRVYAENEAGMGPGLLLHTPVRIREGIGE